jgi:hypothetical protein
LEHPGKLFWDALGILRKLHLIESIPHLVDADTEHGEVLWPLCRADQSGARDCERAIGEAAGCAVACMLTEGQADWALNNGFTLFAPVEAHMGAVQLVGIFRLRHLPRTEPTRVWLGDVAEQCAAVVRRYKEMTHETEAGAEYAPSR